MIALAIMRASIVEMDKGNSGRGCAIHRLLPIKRRQRGANLALYPIYGHSSTLFSTFHSYFTRQDHDSGSH
jgi:hypothetical protein